MIIKDKVVAVTGAASGIGRALCRRFAEEKAKAVVAADINDQEVQELADEINGIAVACDVAQESDIINLISHTRNICGPIDIFCSNAGIMIKGDIDVSNGGWQKIWEINMMAHVYAARALVPEMLKRKNGGCLVFTASAAGLLSQIGSSPYSVTKHALVGFAENLAITYGDKGIKVALVCPQAVRSKMTAEGTGAAGVDGMIEPEQVADHVIDALEEDKFMILPHPEVKTYMQRKTSDYDRWILGMQRLRQRFEKNSA